MQRTSRVHPDQAPGTDYLFAGVGGSGTHFLLSKLRETHDVVGNKPDNAFRHKYSELWAGPPSNEGTFAERSGLHDFVAGSTLESTFPRYVDRLRSEPSQTALFGTAAELQLFSRHRVRNVVFLVRSPEHAYLSWCKDERHGDVIASLGGRNAEDAIIFYCLRWAKTVDEFFRLEQSNLTPGLIRFEAAPMDAEALGISSLFVDFDTGKRNTGLSEASKALMSKLIGERARRVDVHPRQYRGAA